MPTSWPLAAEMTDVLAEDLRTAWVPDVGGQFDTEALMRTPLEGTSIGFIETLLVPRPNGGTLRAPVFGAPAHGELHRAVAALPDHTDQRLSRGVCGYRRGAESGFSYSREYRRFRDLSEGEAADAEWVVFADVKSFFDSCTWEVVLSALQRFVPKSDIEPVAAFAESAKRSGLDSLPPGYADARLLANAALVAADDAISLPFVRWVDDYRIFAPTRAAAEEALERLGTALGESGFSLNRAKGRVLSTVEFSSQRVAPLESVYHPDLEDGRHVRAELRTVFLQAVQEPVVNRRQLRFVLPRMAAQRDDFAVDFALRCIEGMPWEAPRLAGYLAAFADRPDVSAAVEASLLSIESTSPWLASRVAALACRTGIRDPDVIGAAAQSTDSPALWGLLLRALALSGHRDVVHQLTAVNDVRDPRAALIARRDVDLDTLPFQPLVASSTIDALRGGAAPRPVVDTLL